MISLFGKWSLVLALCFSLLQGSLPLLGYWRKNPYLLAVARPSAWGQALFILLAYLCLTWAFITNDFSIAYVAANSHPSLPFMYRLTAVWGAHEGSILLWIVMLAMWTIVFAVTQKKQQAAYTLTLTVLGLISFCFICFLLLTSNPFLLATSYQTGQDLNPLLQDPGFVIHPPMLYVGYAGFSIAFALTQAALISGRFDKTWAKATRKFAIAAWSFLTFGIMLGSWWSYRVLGWGGFWFWDPVENTSLLPWIAGTALIHVLVLVEKRQTAKGWAALLSIICFALSLLGTFLVRSGVLISAHTFANDPERGIFLLLLLAILSTASLATYIKRIPLFTHTPTQSFAWVSREMGLLLNSAFLCIAMLTILLGTLYPLILDAFNLGTISVGAPYFNVVMTPIVFSTMALMSIGLFCRWQSQPLSTLWQQIWKKLLGSIIAALFLLWYFVGHIDITAAISLILSFCIILSVLGSIRILPGMALAHIGFAVLVIGIVLSASLSQESNIRIKPGDTTPLGPYQFHFIDTQGVSDTNYRGIRARFDVTKRQRQIAVLYPEKRIYTVRGMVMTKVAIHPSIFRDLYIALGQPLDQAYWSVRIYYKPFIRWIWFGGILMLAGGLLTLLKRKESQH